MGYFQDLASATAGPDGAPALLAAPEDDELEITILGPGTGESMVIHVGGGDWLIVDSFRVPQASQGLEMDPAPIEYLREIGVDPETQVSAVMITHPHTDHYDGISDVVDCCTLPGGDPPDFYFPVIHHSETWIKMLEGPERFTRIEQLGSVVEDARQDSRLRLMIGGKHLAPPFQDLMALTPTSQVVIATDGRRQATLKRAANFSSIVLWLANGNARALLGADLDEHTRFGWTGMSREFRARVEAGEVSGAGLLKAPHHGSQHANLEGAETAISALLGHDPTVVMTRNLLASLDLPDSGVVEHYASLGDTFVVGSEKPAAQLVGWVTCRSRAADGEWDTASYGPVVMSTTEADADFGS